VNASEWTCLWYVRLNGYFTMPNFIAHGRPTARTDVDVLAVRLEHSHEATFQDDRARSRFLAEARMLSLQKRNRAVSRL
jgi:hypothetical protein